MDSLECFLADDYQLEKPYSYMFLEEFIAERHLAHHYWRADRRRWSCCDEKGRLRFLSNGQQFVEFFYDNALLLSKKVYYEKELEYEEFYSYNSSHALENSYLLIKGVKKNFKNYFYDSKQQLIRCQQERHAIHYGYNSILENTSRDFYENEKLQESWKDTFEFGKLKQREEFYANKQRKCRHFYSYDEEGRLQQYKLVSGQKLLLLHLYFRYPVLIAENASRQKITHLWLEREIYRQFNQRHKGMYQLPLHLSRRAITSLKDLNVQKSAFKIRGRNLAVSPIDKKLD